MNQTNNFLRRTKNVLKIFFGLPLTALSVYFIGSVLYNSRAEVIPHVFQLRVFPLILGFIFYLLFFFLRSEIWLQVLLKFGFKINKSKGILDISLSELKRYIPGNIFSFIDRIKRFKNKDISKTVIVKGIFIESVIFVLTSLVVSIPGSIFIFQLTSKNVINEYLPVVNLLEIFGVFFLAAISFIVFYLNLKHIFTIDKIILIFRRYFSVFLLGIFTWVCFGLGNFLIAISIADFSPYTVIPMCSLFVLAWLLGYVSFISPMGIGVREAVIIYALSYLIPLPVATAIAVFLRVTSSLSEIIFIFLAYGARIFIKRFDFVTKFSGQFYILILSVITYIVYFSYVTFEKHNNFFTGRFDLGNMDQTVWNTLHGRFFMLTNPDSTNAISRLSIHADFILMLISPFYIFWQNPKMLLLIQTVVLAFGAFFVFLIAQKILSHRNIALALSISYLLNPFVQKQNLYDFHAITLATTFLLATYYLFIRKKWILFVILLFLSVITKENVFLISSIFGIILFFQNKKKLGFGIFAISLITFYLLVTKFIPGARGSEHFALSYFSEFGDSPTQIVKGFFFNPQKILLSTFSFRTFLYLYKLFLPVGFLPLISPVFLIFALPDILINILSKNENFTSLTFHYAATIIPFVYISATYAVEKIIKKNWKFITETRIFYYILMISIFTAWIYGPLPGSNHPSIEVFANKLGERTQIDNFISKIPQNFSVAATNNLGAHLSHREKIYAIPSGIDESDILLFLLNDNYAQPSLNDQVRMVNDLKNNKNYAQIYRVNDFIVFERKNLAFSQKLKRKKSSQIYPYSIKSLQDRSYQKGQVTIEKKVSETDNFSTYLASYLSDGLRIHMLMGIPKKNEKKDFPVIIINHDFTPKEKYSSTSTLQKTVEYFASKGYVTIRPDYRGYGISEEDIYASHLFAYPVDILNLIYSLNYIENVDENNIVLVGQGGIGGSVTLKILEVAGKKIDLKQKIKGAIIQEPIFDLLSWYTQNTQQTPENNSEYEQLFNELGNPQANPNVWEELSPNTYLDDISTPLLILEETNTNQDTSQSDILYQIMKLKNKNVQLKKVTSEGDATELGYFDETKLFFKAPAQTP